MHKHRLRAFGLALMAVLGTMAFAAVGAQAETPVNQLKDPTKHEHGVWLVEGSAPLAIGRNVTGVQHGTGLLLLPSKKAEIACSTMEVVTAHLLGSGEAKAELLYLGCKVFEIEEKEPYKLIETGGGTHIELAACTMAIELNNTNGHITAKVILLVIKHNGAVYYLAEPLTNPLTGGSFTTINFGGTCGLPAAVSVKGSVGVLAPAAAVKPLLKINSADLTGGLPGGHEVQLLLGDALNFGANPAYVAGEVLVELTDASHLGKAVGAC